MVHTPTLSHRGEASPAKLLSILFLLIVVAAGGLFAYGVDQKRQAESQPDQTWTAKFWEDEKINLIRGELETFHKLSTTHKIELIEWLEKRFRKEELSNQNRDEKQNLDAAIASIIIDSNRRARHYGFKDPNSDE